MEAGPIPQEIRRMGTQGLAILWEDGHRSEYANPYLRDHCPCAECREHPRRMRLPVVERQGGALYATRLGVVGRYALRVEWSDGHDVGIYSYRTLRGLCPCGECTSGRAAGTGAGT